MAYAQLDSPLPNLTMLFHPGAHALLRGCPPCGMGQGDAPPIDPSIYDQFDLPLPVPTYPPVFLDPITTLQPINTDVPWIGDVFQNVGPDVYLNIQTGQTVPGAVATEIAAATQLPTGILQTTGTEQGVDLVDPTTGMNYTGILTQAARVLQAGGQLADATGKLTAQGRALAASGQLVSGPVAPSGAGFSSAIHSLTSWFTGSTLIAGYPNWGVLAAAGAAAFVLMPDTHMGYTASEWAGEYGRSASRKRRRRR